MADFAVGVDLGGTNIVSVVADRDGSVRSKDKRGTEVVNGPEHVLARIADSVTKVVQTAELHPSDIAAVGIGSPGPLNSKEGVVLNPPNLTGWSNVPVKELMQEKFRLDVFLDNDANAAAYGEWWAGAGKGTSNLVCITLGTGVGGGIIIGGELHRGASDCAGEIGHSTIHLNGPVCKCGNRGCLETYVSATAIARRAREQAAAGRETIMTWMVNGNLNDITARKVFEAVQEDDALACEVMADTGRYLGAGLANVVNILNPEIIVISGGVIDAGDYIFEPARRELAKRAFPSAVSAVRIVPAELGDDAGAVGAAGIALNEMKGAR